MTAPTHARGVALAIVAEVILACVYFCLSRVVDGEALAAAMLGGELGPAVVLGLVLVLLRLAVWVFVPMAVVGLSVRALVLTLAEARRPKSRTASAAAPSPSRS